MVSFYRLPTPPAIGAVLLLLAALTAAAPALAATATGSDAERFAAENEVAMTRMMDGMSVHPSGNIDEDFAAMMIPHHQGAIDMAMAELRYGKNEQLRRIAQEIIVDQMQEIAAMRLALGQPLPPSVPAPTQPAASTPSPSQPASHDHSAHAH
ncbi:DUF305 family protein family protein [Cupriavidus metallidurans]|jgi:hypothetical protein|uniref:DUF305 domain-containing protein n=1 Tax=Cupriavidus TaxID=106589 RepID=UPI0004936573|nr:DUF305 domain-containing protein [Cupriavidus metallidurans]AVA35630.1 DUF305 domain-containing protein [Cupriavidus metallidurans]KWW35456.1 hypothetical protein AU374_03523 [Cupriavidus metallidurans]MDE4921597.1 DUF305 domain-containing protein [Cupriavidus metallidurans]UBM08736.1 DUF305 domain-containing protein [Cupriavidus metallidurans]